MFQTKSMPSGVQSEEKKGIPIWTFLKMAAYAIALALLIIGAVYFAIPGFLGS